MNQYTPPAERFMLQISPEPNSGCCGKIPVAVVLELPGRLDNGESPTDIASQLGVTRQSVLQAANRQRARAALKLAKEGQP